MLGPEEYVRYGPEQIAYWDFPRERDKMKLHLRELDLPFYDPLMIVEKTEGRMAEDHCWLRIEQ